MIFFKTNDLVSDLVDLLVWLLSEYAFISHFYGGRLSKIAF